LEVPKFLQNLVCRFLQVDPTFQLGDKDGKPMALAAIPNSLQGCVEKFNLKVVQKRNHQHLMFVTTFMSTKTFGSLKNASMDWLRRHNLYMNRHALDAQTLDVAIAGWILKAHPRYHSPDQQRIIMEKAMKKWWKSLNANMEKLDWSAKLTEDENGELNVPSFFVSPRSVKNQDTRGKSIQESAFLIMGPTERIQILMQVMEAVFNPARATDPSTTIHFIPYRLQKANPRTHYQLILLHRQYLQQFQNVSIAGMKAEFMTTDIDITDPNGKLVHTTLAKAFLLHPAIVRIDPGGYVIPLGKWNLSTSKDSAAEAKAWIDKVILAMPDSQRLNTGFPDFPEVTRMQATPSTSQSSTYDQWAEELLLQATQDGLSRERDQRKQPPSYSTNPQEPDLPHLLQFDIGPSPSGSYAQAASKARGQTVRPGPISNNTSTFLSTMSADKIEGIETNLKSLARQMEIITAKLSSLNEPIIHTNPSNNQGTAATQNSDNSLLQAILQKLDQSQLTMEKHQKSAQERFDALEDQQSGFGESMEEVTTSIVDVTSTVCSIRDEQSTLRRINEELLIRINILEDSTIAQTKGSPVRKRRPKSDDSTLSPSTTEDFPQTMMTDSPFAPTTSDEQMQDEITEFSDSELMTEPQTQPGLTDTRNEAGSDPACGS
jgi:hypothetical protein